MTRRNINHKMLDNVAMDASKTSEKTNVENLDQATIMIDWFSGSTPIGTVTVEASNSTVEDFTTSAEKWHELDFDVAINVTGTSGNHQIDFVAMPFKWLRILYNRTSGDGTFIAAIQASSLGV